MPLDLGLKIPKVGYIEDRLRNCLSSISKADFLRSSQEEDIELLKKKQLIEEFDNYLEVTHHGRNIIEFLENLVAENTTTPIPMSGYMYTAVIETIEMDYTRVYQTLFDNMKEQVASSDKEGFQATLFRVKPSITLEILNMDGFDPSNSGQADPNIPLNWLLYPEKYTVVVATAQSRTYEPMRCATLAGQILGELAERHSFQFKKLETNIGVYLLP